MTNQLSENGCYVYVIDAASGNQCTSKIGVAKNPTARLKELSTGSPYTLRLFQEWLLPSRQEAMQLEQNTLRALRRNRLAGDWVFLSADIVAGLIEALCAVEADACYRKAVIPRLDGRFIPPDTPSFDEQMILSGGAIRQLIELGLNAEGLAIVAEIIEREMQRIATVAVAPLLHSIERRAMTSTERSRLYRQKARQEGATKCNTDAMKSVALPLHVSPEPLSIGSSPPIDKSVGKEEGKGNAREASAQEIVVMWNRFAEWVNASSAAPKGVRISKVEAVPDKRKKMISARLKDYTQEQMVKALNIVRQTPGLIGHNDRNWRANFEWFLRPDTVASILEGKYEHWKPRPKTGLDAAFQRAADGIKARASRGENVEGGRAAHGLFDDTDPAI